MERDAERGVDWVHLSPSAAGGTIEAGSRTLLTGPSEYAKTRELMQADVSREQSGGRRTAGSRAAIVSVPSWVALSELDVWDSSAADTRILSFSTAGPGLCHE